MPKYDVAVVGAGLGGLAAAALLSSKKKKTIVIERGGSLNKAVGGFEKDGFIFFSTPPLSYGFERGGLIHELAAGLGIIQNASAHSPSYQVALPDRRIAVYSEPNATLEELRREFPKEIKSLQKFYRDLHKRAIQNEKSRVSAYLSRHRTVSGFIRKYRFSPELMTFFDIQSLYFFRKPVLELSLSTLITLCDTPPLYLQGGFKQFADQLCGIILQQGGEVRYKDPSSDFALKNGRVVGIKTAQEVVEAGTILLDTEFRQHSSTLFIGLRDEVVPVGMCPHVIFLPDYAQPRSFLALSLGAKDDTTIAPRGMRTLTVSCQSQQKFSADKKTLIDQISRLIPFLNDYLVFAEEDRGADRAITFPADFSFKPLRSADGTSLLSRCSKRNVYVLNNVRHAPLQVMSAVQRFIKKMT